MSEHKAAPMVDEVSDFEVLEMAVRELAIEEGPVQCRRSSALDGVHPYRSVRCRRRVWWRRPGWTLSTGSWR